MYVVKNVFYYVFSQGRCNAMKKPLIIFVDIYCTNYIVLYDYPVSYFPPLHWPMSGSDTLYSKLLFPAAPSVTELRFLNDDVIRPYEFPLFPNMV